MQVFESLNYNKLSKQVLSCRFNKGLCYEWQGTSRCMWQFSDSMYGIVGRDTKTIAWKANTQSKIRIRKEVRWRSKEVRIWIETERSGKAFRWRWPWAGYLKIESIPVVRFWGIHLYLCSFYKYSLNLHYSFLSELWGGEGGRAGDRAPPTSQLPGRSRESRKHVFPSQFQVRK